MVDGRSTWVKESAQLVVHNLVRTGGVLRHHMIDSDSSPFAE
jgi:hypothetical protein